MANIKTQKLIVSIESFAFYFLLYFKIELKL